MNQKAIVRVSATQDLEIPLEIKRQLEPLSEYELTFNSDEIILKKISQPLTHPSLPILRPASGKSFLRHAGTWEGDDFEDCLQSVYDNRSQIEI